jgi:predicted metal-dependent hydrolase
LIRIKGLVRAASQIRQQLQAGIRPAVAQPFREQVASILRKVETFCARGGATPDFLPTRSRQAYRYLKGLNLEHLPLPSTRGTRAAGASLRIKNVVKIGDYLADLCWQQTNSRANSDTTHVRIRRDIQHHADAIEKVCARQQGNPTDLATPTRRVYCWLRFLLNEDNLAQHRAALAQARVIVEHSQPQLDRPLRLYLVSLDSLWRKNQYNNALLLRVNEGFLTADQEVWEALIGTALYQRNRDHDHKVRDFGESEEFSEVIFELETFAGLSTTTARGQHHDLEESFHRVNDTYFQGSISKPNLAWSRTQTVQTFGHYQAGRDMVTLSLSLDQPTVPPALVDYLMYHELLHKKHGTTVVNGRRLVHTPAFKSDERNFPDYQAVGHQLKELALSLRGRA